MKVAVIIPFRSRGNDPLREANLIRVTEHWSDYNSCQILVTSDGRDGDEQFNRSAAYNLAATSNGADVLVFTESDILIGYEQIDRAVALAVDVPGLVIPFSWFIALSDEDSWWVRARWADPVDCRKTTVKGHRGSIGAVNVMSRETYDLTGGYDDRFEGWGYDDDAMKIAFEVCAGPTRWVEGSAYHLYHSPGGAGSHLSHVDRVATSCNRQRLQLYRQARTPEQIRELTGGSS